MPLEILEVHFDRADSQNLVGWRALVVAPCAFSDMMVTFRGRRKGNLVFLVQSRLFVRRGTLDTVVIFEAL